MDVFDQASEREDQFRDLALKAARSHAEERPEIDCISCGGTPEMGKECRHYASCLEDWDLRDKAKKRNGKGE